MKLICNIGKEGVRILRCFSYDGQVELPDRIHGMAVTELGAYAFAETVPRAEPGVKYLAEIGIEEFSVWEWKECPQEILMLDILPDGMPVVKGCRLTAVSLPRSLKKIGAYAFYQCEKLEKIRLFCTVADLGAGLFTGCYGVSLLEIWMIAETKSCLKEILAELRQTLRVNCCRETGEVFAKLIFPEYFEESVENTPARILTQEMHGCGHRYRNAFSGTQIQYAAYDKLFAHVQVQESADLVMELVLGRLMYPIQLSEERRKVYEAYALQHGREAVRIAVLSADMEILRFMGRAKWCTKVCIDEMLAEAGQQGNAQATGILMEYRRRLISSLSVNAQEETGKYAEEREWAEEKTGEEKKNRRRRFSL